MCLGIPGQIIELQQDCSDLAVVDVSGVRRNINIVLLEGEKLQPGDWVLIHVGFAMAKINEKEAKASLALLEEMIQAYTNQSGSGDSEIE